MGLAERFKDRLDKKDIFNHKIEQTLEQQSIKFISKPTIIQPKEVYTNIKTRDEVISNIYENINKTNIDDLESEIINKIRKTPYWEEYSSSRQEKMISSYFDKKIKTEKYSKIEKTSKEEFVKNIMILANNK